MTEINPCDSFTLKYPFIKCGKTICCDGDFYRPGCNIEDDKSDPIGVWNRIVTADAVGTITLTVINVVEMPGRYQSRVFYKKEYQYKGFLFKNNRVHVDTIGRFKKRLEKPFPMDYEVN